MAQSVEMTVVLHSAVCTQAQCSPCSGLTVRTVSQVQFFCNEALSVTMFSVTMFGDRCVGRLCGPGILNSARCFNVHVAQAPWLRSRLGVCLSCSSPGCGCCRVFAHRPTSCCEREAPGQPPAQPEQRYVAFEATPHQKNRLERVSEEQLTINEQGRPNSV